MSTGALGNIPADGGFNPAGESPTERSESFWAKVARDTLRQGGARFGLVWILILVLAAVLAPLVANTEPYLVKINGHLSSPLFRCLNRTDVVLWVGAAAVLVAACFKKISLAKRFVAVSSIIVVAIFLAWLLVHPPVTINWQYYRDLERDGKIEFKLMAPVRFSPNDSQLDDLDAALLPPSSLHWMGTDTNGRDIFSRMVHACRIALAIGLVSTGVALVIGVIVGGIMGYFVGWVDMFGMRVIEIFEGVPTLFLLIFVVAFWGHDLYKMMVIIGLTTWTQPARFLRAEFLRLRQQDFVQAAIAAGLPLRSVLFRHLLPNGITPILVITSFSIASAILYESTLSFLGIGLVDEPSWGQMLNQALGVAGSFIWWIALFPGLAIFLTVFSYNLLGEALQTALDPKAIKT